MQLPRHWRLNKQRYALEGEICPHCQAKIFPPRDICPECGEEAHTPLTLSGRGQVYSYTTVYQAPASHEEQAPYTVALVKLDEGPTVTAQLTDIDERVLFLEGDRQSFQDHVLIIRKEPISNLLSRRQPQKVSEAMKKYLEPTPFVQSDHPEIQAKVKEIISYDDPMMVKAKKLVEWVYRNLQKRPVLSVPNALEILRHRVGDCNEHAVLLMALAQAAGIPAQMEAGIVYRRGRFYYHAWNVLYLGAWVTADATMGQFPADVTHIRLVRGMERQVDLMRVIGRMKIDIEGYSR